MLVGVLTGSARFAVIGEVLARGPHRARVGWGRTSESRRTRVLVDVGAVGPSTAVVAVDAGNPAPPPGRGEEFGKASPIALVVVVILALATVVLVRSMTKRIRRLPSSFDRAPKQGEAPARGAEDAGGLRG